MEIRSRHAREYFKANNLFPIYDWMFDFESRLLPTVIFIWVEGAVRI